MVNWGWGTSGRRHWVGINFCHPEVGKLQQQCHTCKILFLIYPQTTGSIKFFSWERENANILETATGELEGKVKMAIQ